MRRILGATQILPILGLALINAPGLWPGGLRAQEASQPQQALAANTLAPTQIAAAPARPGEKSLADLQRSRISAYELKIAGGGDPANAPAALVAGPGDSRLQHLSHV